MQLELSSDDGWRVGVVIKQADTEPLQPTRKYKRDQNNPGPPKASHSIDRTTPSAAIFQGIAVGALYGYALYCILPRMRLVEDTARCTRNSQHRYRNHVM